MSTLWKRWAGVGAKPEVMKQRKEIVEHPLGDDEAEEADGLLLDERTGAGRSRNEPDGALREDQASDEDFGSGKDADGGGMNCRFLLSTFSQMREKADRR